MKNIFVCSHSVRKQEFLKTRRDIFSEKTRVFEDQQGII